MYKIDEIKMLRLGQRDENISRSLTFDCSDWLEQYPEASIHILFRRPGESAIVPMSTTLEGNTLTWLIHDFEVGKTGIGNAEFRAVDTAGLRRKSRIIPCSIEETLLGDDETVLYTQDQVDETLAHISEAAQAALAAKASEEAAALSASEAEEFAASAGTAADMAVSAKTAAQAAQTAAETAQHQAEAAQDGVHADAVAAEQAKVAAQAAQASAQGAASQASADRTAAETARADAEAAATHAEEVVEGIDQAGADQVAAVNAAGQAQVTAVNTTGATQVGNVNAAGTTQVSAVQAKGTQVINSIPTDYSALSQDVTGLKSAIEHKAEIDGYYQDMTVGDAEQLVSSQMVEDGVPYLFRKSGGSKDIGNRAYLDKIVGGSVVLNQRLQNGNFENDDWWIFQGVTNDGISDNVLTVSFPADTTKQIAHGIVNIVNGHKFLSTVEVNLPDASAGLKLFGGTNVVVATTQAKTGWQTLSAIWGSETYPYWLLRGNGVAVSGVQIRNACIFDLTQMFGSTIADYVYNLEQSNAGAGVAWFRNLFPAEYYPYSEGELISVSGLSEHKTVGFNRWDEEWLNGYYSNTGSFTSASNQICTKNMIPVLPNITYCITVLIKGTDRIPINVAEYDSNGAFLRKVFVDNISPSVGKIDYTTSPDTYFVNVNFSATYGATYKNDICINLSDPSRNGTYEPYERHSYPLDSSLTLRGIPKLDAENNLYYDGDEYTPDGKVNRRYGIVDLGTVSWTKGNRNTADTGYVYRSGAQIPVRRSGGPIISTKFTNKGQVSTWESLAVNEMSVSAPQFGVIICADYNTAEEFKTAMSGVMLVYELATPTEETAEPYRENQIVDAFGTEEFVSDSIVPVGHLTEYPANLRDKLEHLPDLASVDGVYMVHQQSGQMSLTPHPIPLAPSTDGTYTLKATVSNGTITYTWEAVT